MDVGALQTGTGEEISDGSQLSGLANCTNSGTNTKVKKQRKGQGLREDIYFRHSDFEVPVGQLSGDT